MMGKQQVSVVGPSPQTQVTWHLPVGLFGPSSDGASACHQNPALTSSFVVGPSLRSPLCGSLPPIYGELGNVVVRRKRDDVPRIGVYRRGGIETRVGVT